jgi:hypothetical protein
MYFAGKYKIYFTGLFSSMCKFSSVFVFEILSVFDNSVQTFAVKDYTGHVKLPRSGGRTFVSVKIYVFCRKI